jgi:hypothetical protein
MAETTRTDVIRETLRNRNRKLNLGIYARSVGVGIDLLEAFIDGRRTLPAAVLHTLAKGLWPHAEFDPQLDVLRSALKAPAKPLGVPPQLSFPLPKYRPDPAQCTHRGEVAPAPKPKRAGWLASWI